MTSLALAVGAIVLVVIMIAAVAVVPGLLQHFLASPPLRWVLLAVEAVLLFLVLVAVLAALYRFAPAGQPAGMRWASAGAVLAAVVLALFSLVFALYVNLIGTYSKSYGALAGVIVLMLWLYYAAYVVLIGALINAEGEREMKGNANSEPEDVNREVVRSPNEERQEAALRPAETG